MESAATLLICSLTTSLALVLNLWVSFPTNEKYLMSLVFVCIFFLPFFCWYELNVQRKAKKNLESSEYWIIGFLTLIAFLLRVSDLDGRGIWLDEQMQVIGALKDPKGPIHAASGQQQPPLNYIFEGMILKILGLKPWIMRLQSFLCGVVAVPAFYILLRSLRLKVGSASFGTLILTVGSSFIYFSQDARPYSAAVLAAVLCLQALYLFWMSPPSRVRAFILFGFIMNLSLTIGLQPQVFLGVLGICTLPFLKDRDGFKKLAICFLFLLISSVLTAVFLTADFGASSEKFILQSPEELILGIFQKWSWGDFFLFYGLLFEPVQIQGVVFFVLALGSAVFAWKNRVQRPMVAGLGIFSIIFPTIFQIFYHSIINTPFRDRYMLIGLIPLLILLSFTFEEISRHFNQSRLRRESFLIGSCASVLVLASIFSIPRSYDRHYDVDWPLLYRFFRAQGPGPNTALLLDYGKTSEFVPASFWSASFYYPEPRNVEICDAGWCTNYVEDWLEDLLKENNRQFESIYIVSLPYKWGTVLRFSESFVERIKSEIPRLEFRDLGDFQVYEIKKNKGTVKDLLNFLSVLEKQILAEDPARVEIILQLKIYQFILYELDHDLINQKIVAQIIKEFFIELPEVASRHGRVANKIKALGI